MTNALKVCACGCRSRADLLRGVMLLATGQTATWPERSAEPWAEDHDEGAREDFHETGVPGRPTEPRAVPAHSLLPVLLRGLQRWGLSPGHSLGLAGILLGNRSNVRGVCSLCGLVRVSRRLPYPPAR